MMRRNANLLLSVAATVLTVAGCSPFHSKIHRQASHEVADPAAIAEAESTAGSRFQLPGLPRAKPSATKPKADKGKIQQLTALARLSERRGQGQQDEQAEQAFRKIISLDPDNPLPYHRLGIMNAKRSRFDEAERFLSKAYELNPTDPKLLSDIGYFYYLRSDNEKAEEFLRYALRFDSSHKAGCNNLGILLGEQGRYDEAEAFFRRGCKNEAEVETNMAFVYSQRGELTQAVDAYSRALTVDNTLRPAAHGLLNLARMQERADAANTRSATSLERAERRLPDVADVSTAAPRRTMQGQTRRQFKPAEIVRGNEVGAEIPVASDTQPTSQPVGTGLLATLSNFAESLSAGSEDLPPAYVADPVEDLTPTEEVTQTHTTASADDATSTEDDAISTTNDARRQMAVRALFTSPGDAAGEPAATEDRLTVSDNTEPAPRGFLTPKAGGLQRRLLDLRTEETGHDGAPPIAVTQLPATPPEKLTAAPTATARPSKPAVSVRISDLTDEPAEQNGLQGDGESASKTTSSRRRVSPASYDPADQDARQAGIRQLFSATTAEHSEALDNSGAAERSVDTQPNEADDAASPSDVAPEDEAVQDFLDTWLDLKHAPASDLSDAPTSSRRVQPE